MTEYPIFTPCNLPRSIRIGYTGENNFRRISVDFSKWIRQYPQAQINACMIRPGDEQAAPVIVMRTGNIVTWNANAWAMSKAGFGKLEFQLFSSGTIGKTATIALQIVQALPVGSTPPPDPDPTWYERVIEAANAARESAEAAAASAEEIEDLTVEAHALPAGSTPTVEKTGGEGEPYNLDFGIPKGDDGTVPVFQASRRDDINIYDLNVGDLELKTGTVLSVTVDKASDAPGDPGGTVYITGTQTTAKAYFRCARIDDGSHIVTPPAGYFKPNRPYLFVYNARNATDIFLVCVTPYVALPISIVNGGTGANNAAGARENLGLGNVNNTSDLAKPISTATQGALNGKVDKVTGKGLSANDYSNAEKAKVAAAQSDITGIEGKIPAQASAQNQLADKAFVNSSINSAAAFFRGNFQTLAALNAVAWQTTDPTAANYVSNNDYAYIVADESHSNQGWRYMYKLEAGAQDNGWKAQFKVNDTPLTAAQLAALNSGATEEIIDSIADKVDKESGKGLSTNDYTDTDAEKVASAVQSVNGIEPESDGNVRIFGTDIVMNEEEGSTIEEYVLSVQNLALRKQDKLPTAVNDRYLHTNADTGALEWAEVQSGEGKYELIEKVIVGYSITTTRPADWTTNWTDYFTNTGTAKAPVYTPVGGDTAPTWEAGMYYSYSPTVSTIQRYNEPDGTPYHFKKLFLYSPNARSDKADWGGIDCYNTTSNAYTSNIVELSFPGMFTTTAQTVILEVEVNGKNLTDGFIVNCNVSYAGIMNNRSGSYLTQRNGSGKDIIRWFSFGMRSVMGALMIGDVEVDIYGVRA